MSGSYPWANVQCCKPRKIARRHPTFVRIGKGMGYRIYREDPELDRLIDECIDLRIKLSLLADERTPELVAMLNELGELEKLIAKRQRVMRNATPDQVTA